MKYENRLAELRGNVSQKTFAESLGLKQQNYWKYENGVQGMRSDLIEKVCRMFECSAEWLLCMDSEPNPPADDGHVDVPLLSRIAAGKPIEMEDRADTFPIPAHVRDKYPNAFLLKVDGESMNRILPNGCYALVDPCKEVLHDGMPYAVCVNGHDATVKRVRRLNNGFELVPDSTDPTFEGKIYNYNEPQTETVTVVGEVVFYVLPYDWSF